MSEFTNATYCGEMLLPNSVFNPVFFTVTGCALHVHTFCLWQERKNVITLQAPPKPQTVLLVI